MKRVFPLILAGVLLTACAETEAPDAVVQTEGSTAVTETAAPESGDATSDSASLDPCSVITPAELNAATGLEFAGGVPSANQSNITGCSFSTADGNGSIAISIYLQFADDTYAQYQAMPGMTAVSGVDGGYSSDMLDTFVVRKGERVLVLAWRNVENPGEWLPAVSSAILDEL